MGVFDSVMVPCPTCKQPVEFQTKVDDEAYLRKFNLDNAPSEMLTDIMNEPTYCMNCGGWMALVDPHYPPGQKPKPNLQPVKVRAPENPRTHFQGFRWWPDDKPFSFADIES